MKLLKLEDRKGWTNGFLADLTGWYMPTVEAKAKLKGIEFDSRKPKIQPLLDQNMDESHEVEKIEFDLTTKTAILHNASIEAKVNPKFLAYFQKAYQDRGGIERLGLTGEFTPVKVYANDELVGLIMPIKAHN